MAYRKHGGGRQVRLQIRLKVKTKGDVMRAKKIFRSKIAEAKRMIREGEVGCCSIRGRLEKFLQDSNDGLGRRPAGYKTLERHRRRLLIFDKAFQGKPLDAIEREHVERWIHRRLAAGVSPDTVNADLISLRAFARWAQFKGDAPAVLPLLTVNRLYVRGKLAGKNRKPPMAKEIGELLAILGKIRKRRADMGLFLLGMALFGLRPANVWKLRREDAKPPRGADLGRLHVKGIKGTPDRWLAVPAGSLRAKWLRDCLALGRKRGADQPRSPLVPSFGGKSSRNPGGWTTGAFDMALRRLLASMKIRLTAYQVRHSCMTWLLRSKRMGPAHTQRYAGHTRLETQNAYNHLIGHEAEPAYEEMEKVMRENGF